jgi:Holliday junction resolvase
MAMTPEAKVKKRVREMLDKLGIYHFSPPGMGLGRSGIPDIIACFNGKFIGIECKAGKGQPTLLQSRELGRIDMAGGKTFVLRETNTNELEDYLCKNTN